VKKAVFLIILLIVTATLPQTGYSDENVMNLVEISTEDAMITYALTVQEYSHDEFIDEFSAPTYQYHPASIEDAGVITQNYSTYQYLWVEEGLLTVATGELCTEEENSYLCAGIHVPLTSRFRGLVKHIEPKDIPPPAEELCNSICYDPSTDTRNTPFNSNSSVSVDFSLSRGMAAVLWGYFTQEGCVIKGTDDNNQEVMSLCYSSGSWTFTFKHPDGNIYSVSAPAPLKKFQHVGFSVNTNFIGIVTKVWGEAQTHTQRHDFPYNPLNMGVAGQLYTIHVSTAKGISDRAIGAYEGYFLPSTKFEPFCSDAIAECPYNIVVSWASPYWIDSNRMNFGVFVQTSAGPDTVRGMCTYTEFSNPAQYTCNNNRGDLFTNSSDRIEDGSIGVWFTQSYLEGIDPYICDMTGEQYGNLLSCEDNCYKPGTCSIDPEHATCPLGSQYPCNPNGQCERSGYCQETTKTELKYICPAYQHPDKYDDKEECDDNCFIETECQEQTAYQCPLDPTLPCDEETHTCIKTGTCTYTNHPTYTYYCPINGQEYDNQQACNDACIEQGECQDSGYYTCPLGDQYPCNNQHQCTKTGSCSEIEEGYNAWVCSLDDSEYETQSACVSRCVQTGTCTPQTEPQCSSWWCPDPCPDSCPVIGSVGGHTFFIHTYDSSHVCIGYLSSPCGCCGTCVSYNHDPQYIWTDYLGNKYLAWATCNADKTHCTVYVEYTPNESTVSRTFVPCVNVTKYKCSLNNQLYNTQTQCLNACQTTGSCTQETRTRTRYKCSLNGLKYDTLSACESACQQSAQCTYHAQWTCSLNGQNYTDITTCNQQCKQGEGCETHQHDHYSWDCSLDGQGYSTEADCEQNCIQEADCNSYLEYFCPINEQTYPDSESCENACKQPQECIAVNVPVTGFVCSLDGEFYYTEGECSQNCKAIANCEGAYRCDINNGIFFDEDECKENCRINGNCLSIDEHVRGGVIQNHSQGEYSEDYAMELKSVPLEMTFEKIGFFRDIHFKLGYESHRHPDWLEGNYNCIWKDTGIIPNFCTEGQVETDDGCFRQIAHLCPDDHYEIPDATIQGTSNDKQWWCYRFVEDASCWEDDETQFGNGCYIFASPAHPTICPSGSTFIPWPEQNYMCLFQQNPFTDPYCPPGQQAYEGNCYYTATPTCPSGWTRNGGICEKTEDACPQGYDYILFNVICRSGNTFADPSDGTCNGCPAGYSCLTNYEVCYQQTASSPPCPSGQYEYYDLCFYTSAPSCSSGCSRDGGTCNCTQSACPAGYDYFADMDICRQWTQVACLPGYTWNGSSSLCEKYEEAQCASGERKNDPETGEAGCYIFKRHIYCRPQNPDDPCTYGNLVFYQDDCYCKSEPNCDNLNEDVIIGTTHKNPDTCWALDHKLCPANNQFKDRGELKSEDRCLEKVLCPEEINKPASAGDTTWTLARVAAYQNFGSTESIGLRGEYTDTETGITYGISLPTGQTVGESGFASCPLGNGSKCQEIIPFYWACGSEHQCDACFAPPLNPYYSITKVKAVNPTAGPYYGITLDTYTYNQAQTLASEYNGFLPDDSDAANLASLFSGVSYWKEGQPPEDETEHRAVIIKWNNLGAVGFYARCVYDDNKDPLCPGFLVECQNGECPFTDDQGNPLPCQPYEGGQYCSPFKCNSLVDPANIPEPDEGEENDKKDDGTIDEYGNCLGTIYIFNGQTIFCRDNGIKTLGVDCCADPGGNFLFFKMKCNEQEVQLVEARRHGMAHKVGEFCALKIFGICFQPKQSWCVFKSMLGRIIAEQGRPQIGNGLHGEGFGPSCSPSNPDACWGSAKSPDCRGFTPEEFQRLDFSKIDLTEFYEHIKTRAESDIQQKTQEKAMEQLQHYY